MKFEYFDMLTGDPILLQGVGHLRSPKLKELRPTSGIGYNLYNFYLNFLSWDKEKILQYDQASELRGTDRLSAKETKDILPIYDIVTLLPQTRELCREVLSFFVVEKLDWDDNKRKFIVYTSMDDKKDIVGEINRENFEEIRKLILQLNFIGLGEEEASGKPNDKHSGELWEKAQAFLKKQKEQKKKEDAPEYHLGNIISKLCTVHPSYNLLNIWEMTVFQIYDAFFQYGHMRMSDLNEAIFSNHGGDKFVYENWLKPILPNV